MRKIYGAVVGALLLSSCGGGGGSGIASTPAPTPAPTPSPTPTPASATIGNLRANQTFTADAAQTDASFNLTSSTTIIAKPQATSLSVRYDATSNSYEISGSGRSETFTPADRQAGTVEGETRYVHRSDGNASYLTLVTTPYLGSTPNRYVGLGYYQRNAVASERQETGFATFIYGFDTPATGVPRSGSATFATDVFGLASTPGAEPDVFQGRGRFDVDFVNGLFSTSTYVTRTGLISGKGEVGGGLDLTGGGRLSVSTGAFGGDIVYSSGSQQIAGRLTGRFFGPNADELGASFSGSTSDGSAFNGALTAQRDTTLTATNISFARMVTPQLFYADTTTLTVRTPRNGGTPAISDYPGDLGRSVSRSTLEDKTSGNVRYGGPYSSIPGGDYTVTSIVSGDDNFTSYARTIADQPTRLDLYKTGAANRELALTYTSFGRYATTNESDPFASEAVAPSSSTASRRSAACSPTVPAARLIRASPMARPRIRRARSTT
jgi:hypothetical protein